jgi:hypothetical protein
MIDGLSFLAYTIVIGLWTLVWAALGAIVANGRGQAPMTGFVQGALLGPLGVILMPILAMFRDEAAARDLPESRIPVEGLPPSDTSRDMYG